MPDDRMHIVNNREIADICVQHLVAMTIVDGTATFASVHDHDRIDDPAVRAVRAKIELVGSPELTVAKPARQAIVEVELADGRKARHHAKAVRGTPDNPMTTAEIETKAIDLVAPISGEAKAKGLVAAIGKLAVAEIRARAAPAAAGVVLRRRPRESRDPPTKHRLLPASRPRISAARSTSGRGVHTYPPGSGRSPAR